jgi:hypothetical protein
VVGVTVDGAQYGHEGRHHGTGAPDCPRELHHHHDERCTPPGVGELADRRQRAREAFWDRYAPEQYDGDLPALNDAIETATRVRVTREIQLAAAKAYPFVDNMITAAFRAAGFEVEE